MSARSPKSSEAFRHEALFYAGKDGFLEAALPFLRSGISAVEPTLVVIEAEKIAMLQAALGDHADRVFFADMAEIGFNPGRIIGAWREFVTERFADGRPLRGIGEPIWAERTSAELVECQRHEALLNIAFADTPGFWLLCPYDTEALDPAVIEEARRSHPFVLCDGTHGRSPSYCEIEAEAFFDEPLAEPNVQPDEIAFSSASLPRVREFVGRQTELAGFDTRARGDFVLAVNEVVTNSLRHGGGQGLLRSWRESDTLVCEVRDSGRFVEPLVGRVLPSVRRSGGRGLWLANQLCDLVQIRSSPAGSVVRLKLQRRDARPRVTPARRGPPV